MKYIILISIFFLSCAQNIPNKEQQIADAVMAAPEAMRAESTVLGFTSDGKIVEIRKGTNGLICLADDPIKKGFNVAAYHESLEPFMARGRQLKAEGKSFQEIFDTREKEAKSGKLKMPKSGTILHVYQGNTKEDAIYRYVVYTPWETTETTGIPTSPQVPGGPWIMNPGTHRSHIMISPPNPPKEAKKDN